MARLDAARALLERAVADRVTPGAQLSARFADGARESVSVGSLDYGPDAPAVTSRTVYDLASITKVFTALALVRLAHREGVDLARPIDLQLASQQKGWITFRTSWQECPLHTLTC